VSALRSTLGITSGGLNQETQPIAVQIEQINDQLAKSRIINPLEGTVLVKYARAHEMAVIGKPLYKVANLREMILRAYVTGDQLPQIKTGQTVEVLTDKGDGDYASHSGTISWISDKAEFTPKTIQTKDERANLVYATKIKVPNNGDLKIGMYAEIKFRQ
jgi:HlyD family secretion protein